MLTTRPFTNEEVAARLELGCTDQGMIAEACRRLRGLPGSRCPSTAWSALTDEDRDRAFQSLPDMLEGFMKKWGWLHFAKAIEDICREKNHVPESLPTILPEMIPSKEEA